VRMDTGESTPDLGWKIAESKRKKGKYKVTSETITLNDRESVEERRQLAAELSARLARDTQLRYAEREFEMQRALMGKGGRRKLRGIEKVEGGDKDESEDEDARDDQRSGKGKKRDGGKVVDEKTWKPRVYKWKLERRR